MEPVKDIKFRKKVNENQKLKNIFRKSMEIKH